MRVLKSDNMRASRKEKQFMPLEGTIYILLFSIKCKINVSICSKFPIKEN